MLEILSCLFFIVTLILGYILLIFWLFRFDRKEMLLYADFKDFVVYYADWLFNIKIGAKKSC